MSQLTAAKSTFLIVIVSILSLSALPLQAAIRPQVNSSLTEVNQKHIAFRWGDVWNRLQRLKGKQGLQEDNNNKFLCLITPGKLRGEEEKGTIQVWGEQPLFLWQGEIKGIEVRHLRSNKLMWQQTIDPNVHHLTYQGEALESGQDYYWWGIEPGNKRSTRVIFRLMEPEKRDRITGELAELENQLKAEKASVSEVILARVNYFADQELWSDALREVYAREDFLELSEKITTKDFCSGEIGNREQGTENSTEEVRRDGNLDDAYRSFLYYSSADNRVTGYRQGERDSLLGLGHAYNSLGAFDQATEYLEQSLQIAMEIGDIQGEGESLESLGLTLHNSDKLAEAEQNLRQAIARYEEIRKGLGNNDDLKLSIFDKQTLAYSLLQKVLVAQNKPLEALEIAERGRNRALVEMLFRHGNEELRGKIIPPSPNIEEIRRIARQQNATIVEYSVIPNLKYAGITSKAKNLGSQIYIWVIQPTGNIEFRSVQIPEDTYIQGFVNIVRKSLGVRRSSYINDLGTPKRGSFYLQELHKLLIEPIAEFLPIDEEEHVIFIPHKSLFFLSFAALTDSDESYLIEKHTILTAPSIQALGLTSKQKTLSTLPRGEEVLIVGNPLPPKLEVGEDFRTFHPLPGAEKEAIRIAEILGTKPILGAAATEPNIVKKMTKAKLIHITNCITCILKDIKSIRSLSLQAELVVLSGSETGTGEIKGEEVLSLSRSFIAAGVPTLVVSLWETLDDDTNFLMTEFYTNLFEKKLDKAQALRQAMLTMLNEDRGNFDPIAWGQFTLIGQP